MMVETIVVACVGFVAGVFAAPWLGRAVSKVWNRR